MRRIRFILEPPAPYSLARTVERLTRFSEVVDRVDEEGVYRRLLVIDGDPTLIRVRQTGAGLEIELAGDRVRRVAHRRAAEEFVRRALGAGRSLRPFYRCFAADPLLARAISENRGLHVVGTASVFESILTAVLAQQVNLGFAYSIRKELAEVHGERLVVDGETYIAFPEPSRLARLSEARLRRFRLSRMKAIAIRGISRAFASGELSESELAELADEEVVDRLTRYKGIGRWTAEITLMRGLGRPDVFPAGDLWIIKNMASEFLGREEVARESEMRDFSERWRPHRSLALVYAHKELQRRIQVDRTQ